MATSFEGARGVSSSHLVTHRTEYGPEVLLGEAVHVVTMPLRKGGPHLRVGPASSLVGERGQLAGRVGGVGGGRTERARVLGDGRPLGSVDGHRVGAHARHQLPSGQGWVGGV